MERAPTGYVDPNFPNPNGPNDATIIIYGYTPSLALNVFAAVLFIIATAGHAFFIFRYRTWWFIPILVGCIMEVVGYIFRAIAGKRDPYNVIYFVIQYFFIVVAPVFFSAAIYTILSKLINAVPNGRAYSPLRPRLILWIFIVCDVIATIIQILGAALIGSAESNRKDPTTANNILLGGLAFQVFTFAVFCILFGLFLIRARNVVMGSDKSVTVMPFTLSVVVATLAVYLRTCFRLAETAQGLMEYLSTHEVFFGCLEFAPIVVAVYLLLAFHPGRWLRTHQQPSPPERSMEMD